MASKVLFSLLTILVSVTQAATLPQTLSHSLIQARQTPSNSCTDGVHIIAGPGYGAGAGSYSLLSTLVNNITSLIPNSNSFLLGPYGSGTVPQYTGAVEQQARQYLSDYNTACPKSSIVLVGFSAGAIVTMNTLCGATVTPSWNKTQAVVGTYPIIASVVYGEETQAGPEPYNTGTCTGKPPKGSRDPSACQSFFSHMQSYCDATDPQCCAGGNDANSHFAYPAKYDVQAAQFVQSQWMALQTSQPPPTSTTISTITQTQTSTTILTATSTLVNTLTATSTTVETSTATEHSTILQTSIETETSTALETSTSVETSTATETSTLIKTSTSAEITTATETSTAIETSTATETSTVIETSTLIKTSTSVEVSTATETSISTSTAVETSILVETSTSVVSSPTTTETATETATISTTDVRTLTTTVPQTITITATATASKTSTLISTKTSSIRITSTITQTSTAVQTAISTKVSTRTDTSTLTLTTSKTVTKTTTKTKSNAPKVQSAARLASIIS